MSIPDSIHLHLEPSNKGHGSMSLQGDFPYDPTPLAFVSGGLFTDELIRRYNDLPKLIDTVQAIRDFDTGSWINSDADRGKLCQLLDALYKHLR